MNSQRRICALFVIRPTLVGAQFSRAQDYVRDSGPELFSYDELVQVSHEQPSTPASAEELRVVTTSPFVNNEAYYAEARPQPRDVKGLGPALCVVWSNIERGLLGF